MPTPTAAGSKLHNIKKSLDAQVFKKKLVC